MNMIFGRRNFVTCFLVFLLGISLGVMVSFLTPGLATAYVALVERRVFSTMGTPVGVPLGLRHVGIIFANNMIPVILGFLFPVLIAAYNLGFARRHQDKYEPRNKRMVQGHSKRTDRLSSELYFNLTAFGLVLAFAFGFFVFGLFFGYMMRLGGVGMLMKGLRDIGLHAPFEVASIIMSFSIALGLRDLLLDKRRREGLGALELRRFLWDYIKSKKMAISLTIIVFLLLAGALVEVYVSAPIARMG
jgi:uncharacterized membrane protein SpoIIM required for sporulation